MTKELVIKILSGDVLGTKEQTDEAICMAIDALKFCDWVAKKIFSEDMDDAFAELACRRLEKLGVVKADGDKWVLEVGDEE